MKKLVLLITIVITFVTFHSCKTSSGTSSSHVLKLNLEKGKQYDYEMVWDMNQKVMGQENDFSFGAFYTLDVTENDGGIRTLKGTYKKFNMSMKMMGMQIDIDSDDVMELKSDGSREKNPIAMLKKVFSAIVGQSFTMKSDEEGKILEVAGFKEMISNMFDSLGLDSTDKLQSIAALNDQFNDEAVRDQFAQLFYIFPNKKVKEGDSWVKTYSAGGKMPAKYSTTYTVKEVEGDFVTLLAKSKLEPDGDIMINGSQEGELIVDSKTGLVVNAKFDQNISATKDDFSMEIIGKGRIKGTVRE
jgi:hypothetical protein